MVTVENFDIATAYVGLIVRHVASGNHYSVTRVSPAQGQHDMFVCVKNTRGQMAFVGTEYVDPDEFVSLGH